MEVSAIVVDPVLNFVTKLIAKLAIIDRIEDLHPTLITIVLTKVVGRIVTLKVDNLLAMAKVQDET